MATGSTTRRKNIAVLFGGRSVEHEISVISGLEVISALDVRRYHPIPVYIDLRGRWFTGEAVLDREFYRALPQSLARVEEVMLPPKPGLRGLSRGNDVIPVDLFFPVFHGQLGEDGGIQGLFELADVPYTGCGVLASSVAMNKYICKSVLRDHGISVLPAIAVEKFEALADLSSVCDRICAALPEFPLFVKPCNLGSSIGISRAHTRADLAPSLALAFKYDTQVIIEPCISDLFEINVSVLRLPKVDGPSDDIRASVVEIPVAKEGALTYEDKYLSGGKKGRRSAQGMASLVRAIDPEHLERRYKDDVTAAAMKAFRVLGCAGVARFDFLVDKKTGAFYFNELNPLPGSLAYYLWAKSSPPLLYPELLDLIIAQAEEAYARKSTLVRETGFRALFR